MGASSCSVSLVPSAKASGGGLGSAFQYRQRYPFRLQYFMELPVQYGMRLGESPAGLNSGLLRVATWLDRWRAKVAAERVAGL